MYKIYKVLVVKFNCSIMTMSLGLPNESLCVYYSVMYIYVGMYDVYILYIQNY